MLVACGQGSGGSSSPAAEPDSGAEAGPVEAGPIDAGHDAETGVVDAAPAALCLPHFSTGAPANSTACPPAPSSPDTLDALLGGIGLNRCFQLPAWESLFPDAPGDFRLSYFDTIHDTPLCVPPYALGLGADLDAASTSSRPVSQLIAVARRGSARASRRAIRGRTWRLLPGTRRRSATPRGAHHGGRGNPDAATIESQAASIPTGLQRRSCPS